VNHILRSKSVKLVSFYCNVSEEGPKGPKHVRPPSNLICYAKFVALNGLLSNKLLRFVCVCVCVCVCVLQNAKLEQGGRAKFVISF
jgi:hypothetical protein